MSYKVAEALALVELPVVHVYTALPAFAGTLKGTSNAPDDKIAEWCAKTEHVLVTADQDFHGRWVRSGVLARHGVEVVVFDREVTGLQEQHRRITLQLPVWQELLSQQPYGHRVWVQSANRQPFLSVGKTLRKRARTPTQPHPDAKSRAH